MKIKPVHSKKDPLYPTSDYLQEHPELLWVVPERWRQNALVLRVLGGVVCLILAGQTPAAGQRATGAPPSNVAPLFVHGEGRGSYGCVAINPPAYLTEDEARQIIQDEARRDGLEFTPDGLTIPEATLPITDLFMCGSLAPRGQVSPKLPAEQKGNLVLDGVDQRRNVAYEFVSQTDVSGWAPKNPPCMSSVASFDAKGAAEALRRGLEMSPGSTRFGVFYEPYRSGPVDYRGRDRMPISEQVEYDYAQRKSGRALCEEDLRRQVRDFVAWLKAQGVI